MCSVLGISTKEFFTLDDIDADHLYEIQKSFYRVGEGEPEAYIHKKTEFWSNEFYVDERVLIPRNDTEVLVDEAIKEISKNINTDTTTMIDIGTGSSCIPISIIKAIAPLNFKGVYVVDISDDALAVSKINIEKYNLQDQITQVSGSLLEPFLKEAPYTIEKNLCITANLPYIKNNDFANMDMSVVDFEPEVALYG